MIYGYVLTTVNEYDLCEMKEITFAASPDVLREIAGFLENMAGLMESGGFDNCSHIHIGNAIADWDRRFPNKDIIVAVPPQMRRDPPTVRPSTPGAE